MGDIACFSFYATKTITTGEGGRIFQKLSRQARGMMFSMPGISEVV